MVKFADAQPEATQLNAVFAALADSTRRGILESLSGGERAVSELAAKGAGLDMAAARAFAASPAAELELRTNHELARKLGFEGTPSWVAGNQAFSGAVGRERLADAIAASESGAAEGS